METPNNLQICEKPIISVLLPTKAVVSESKMTLNPPFLEVKGQEKSPLLGDDFVPSLWVVTLDCLLIFYGLS